MSGSKDRFRDLGELDQFAQDLDLDMDAPIGATFAAALRDHGPDPDALTDEDGDLISDEDFDDDGFLTSTASIMRTEIAFGASEKARPAGETVKADAGLAEPLTDSLSDDEGFEGLSDAAAQGRARHGGSAVSFHVSDAPGEIAPSAPVAAALEEVPPAPDEVHEAEIETSRGQGFDYAFGGAESGGDKMIPRIAVHAFCVRTGMLGLMRTIQKDRRMRNVTMEVHEGGIQNAIDHYVNETTPNLIVLEATGEPRQLLAELDALSEHCDENIRVVVVGHTNDIRLYRELIRRGVSEYLVAPVDPVQMIRSIATLFADPEAPFVGKTLAVTGVKGGVGASSIAHNLAWALSERVKVNATLVDLDLNFGTTGLDFNEDSGATIADALMSPDRFDEAIMGRLISKATDRLSLFTAPATLDRTYNLDPDTYNRVLEQVRSSVPFVVLDMPHIWSDWFKSTIIGADEIVVVAGPDLASLRNGKNLIDFLRAARPNDSPPRLVLNMVGLPKRPEIPPKDFGSAIGLDPTLVLPFDAALFGTAANNGQMIFDVAPDSKCAQGIDQLATLLSGREIQAAKPSLLKKLMGR